MSDTKAILERAHANQFALGELAAELTKEAWLIALVQRMAAENEQRRQALVRQLQPQRPPPPMQRSGQIEPQVAAAPDHSQDITQALEQLREQNRRR